MSGGRLQYERLYSNILATEITQKCVCVCVGGGAGGAHRFWFKRILNGFELDELLYQVISLTSQSLLHRFALSIHFLSLSFLSSSFISFTAPQPPSPYYTVVITMRNTSYCYCYCNPCSISRGGALYPIFLLSLQDRILKNRRNERTHQKNCFCPLFISTNCVHRICWTVCKITL